MTIAILELPSSGLFILGDHVLDKKKLTVALSWESGSKAPGIAFFCFIFNEFLFFFPVFPVWGI